MALTVPCCDLCVFRRQKWDELSLTGVEQDIILVFDQVIASITATTVHVPDSSNSDMDDDVKDDAETLEVVQSPR